MYPRLQSGALIKAAIRSSDHLSLCLPNSLTYAHTRSSKTMSLGHWLLYKTTCNGKAYDGS